jgi:hypothetical protein
MKSSAETSPSAKISIPRPSVPAPAPATGPAWRSDKTEVAATSADRFRSAGNDDQEDDSEEEDFSDGQSDLRGLSKKQRRKLLRERRDRE